MIYSIGQVAQKVKINKETIRYYEKIGLLENTKRDSNGYRIYSDDDIEILEFILMAKEYNFTLKEISILKEIGFNNKNKYNEKDVVNIIDKKINEIDKKIEELDIIRKVLDKIKTNVFIRKNICYRGKSLEEILKI